MGIKGSRVKCCWKVEATVEEAFGVNLRYVWIALEDPPTLALRFCNGTSWSAAQETSDLLKA